MSSGIQARGERLDRYLYDFRCPACNACGELALPKDAQQFNCPEECGAIFLQWRRPGEQFPIISCMNEQAASLAIAAAVAHGWRARGWRW